MSDINKSLSSNSKSKSTHLFVLIHGLWGMSSHMATIEKFIKENLPSSTDDKIATIKPACFRFWKTYDGLELNAKKIIADIFYEIESLKQNNDLEVTKISIIGYSLGGLISRYVIGLLNELDFFEKIEPIFFSTFATPHVGIQFFNDNIFDAVANRLGPYLFGKSGGQLFIADHDKILVKMADPQEKYMRGLKKFQKHILLANIKNDRTVAFFTSFITDVSPFEELDNIKIVYLDNLPQAKIANKLVRPKFVDLTKSHRLSLKDKKIFLGNQQEETPFIRKNRWAKILVIALLACLVVPFWVPFVLISSTTVSIYSFIKIKFVEGPLSPQHWLRVKKFVYGNAPIDPDDAKVGNVQRLKRRTLDRHESFKGDTSYLTEDTMDRVLYAEERYLNKSRKAGSIKNEDDEDALVAENTDYNTDSDGVDESSEADTLKSNFKSIEMDIEQNDKVISESIETLISYESFPLFQDHKYKLPLNEDKLFIVKNLNTLDWIKIPVFLDVWNAHDGIVSRRGAKTNPKGASTIGLWVSILRNHLQENGRADASVNGNQESTIAHTS